MVLFEVLLCHTFISVSSWLLLVVPFVSEVDAFIFHVTSISIISNNMSDVYVVDIGHLHNDFELKVAECAEEDQNRGNLISKHFLSVSVEYLTGICFSMLSLAFLVICFIHFTCICLY
jgi:hypothetical protein